MQSQTITKYRTLSPLDERKQIDRELRTAHCCHAITMAMTFAEDIQGDDENPWGDDGLVELLARAHRKATTRRVGATEGVAG